MRGRAAEQLTRRAARRIVQSHALASEGSRKPRKASSSNAGATVTPKIAMSHTPNRFVKNLSIGSSFGIGRTLDSNCTTTLVATPIATSSHTRCRTMNPRQCTPWANERAHRSGNIRRLAAAASRRRSPPPESQCGDRSASGRPSHADARDILEREREPKPHQEPGKDHDESEEQRVPDKRCRIGARRLVYADDGQTHPGIGDILRRGGRRQIAGISG